MTTPYQKLRVNLPDRGVELALLDWGGQGPVALLHHATGLLAAPYTDFALELRRRFRVIGVDARGHGDSTKPAEAAAYHWRHFGADFVALAARLPDLLQVERIGLAVGHSLGGAAVLAAAAARPELFDKLAMIDMAGLPKGDDLNHPVLEEIATKSLRRRNSWSSREEAQERWSRTPFFRAWEPSALERYVEEGTHARADGSFCLKCPPPVEADVFRHGASLDIPTLAEKVPNPTLLLWAAIGGLSRERYAHLQPLMRDARLEALQAGHMAPLEAPALTAGALIRFFDLAR